jgi:hypothetical protein
MPYLQTRLAQFDDTGADLHKRITKLTRQARKGGDKAKVRAQVLAADRRLIHLNRDVARFNRSLLLLPSLDREIADSILSLNARVRHTDRDALWMNHYSLAGTRRTETNARISQRYSQSKALSVKVDAKAGPRRSEKEPAQPPADPEPTPTPSPTTSPSPSPSPSPTPTSTPSPTPTLSPVVWPDPPAAPEAADSPPLVPAGWTLIQGQTINNLRGGFTNRYYYRCTFTGGDATNAPVTIRSTTYNVVFDACTFKAAPQNGFTINDDSGREIRDITIKNSLFETSGVMSFECTNRSTADGYRRIDLINNVFEPAGGEAISYDGPSNGTTGDCLIEGNVIKGSGTNLAYMWGDSFEINGPLRMTVRNNHIHQGRGWLWNLQTSQGVDSGWVFTDNVLDASSQIQSVTQRSDKQVVGAVNITGGVFARNTIISAAPGGSVAWISGCRNMDWRTTVWKDADARAGYATPRQVNDCSGNLF